MTKIKPLDWVTIPVTEKATANMYIVDAVEEGGTALLFHPRYPKILLRFPLESLSSSFENKLKKGPTEKGLDFCKDHTTYFGFSEKAELEALIIYFVLNRFLTNPMKQILANLAGKIAKIELSDDLHAALALIRKNEADLDEHNQRWFFNFSKLLTKEQPVTSKKQRRALFNIAGFVMAEKTPLTAVRT